jgi:hypothetical protein
MTNGQRCPEPIQVNVNEALPKLIAGVPLDPPGHALLGVRRAVIGPPEHHQRRPPPSVDRLLNRGTLRRGSGHHRHQQLMALPLSGYRMIVMTFSSVSASMPAQPPDGRGGDLVACAHELVPFRYFSNPRPVERRPR